MTVWYAVYTRPHAETQALANLERQGYRGYLPRCRTRITHARRRFVVLRPLFPRYLFVGLDRAAMRWRPILSTLGVAGLVRAGDEPAAIPEPIIEAIRQDEAAGAFDRLSPRPALRAGELVRLTVGAFADRIGRLAELDDRDRVVVLLDLLGRAVRVRVAATEVEAA